MGFSSFIHKLGHKVGGAAHRVGVKARHGLHQGAKFVVAHADQVASVADKVASVAGVVGKVASACACRVNRRPCNVWSQAAFSTTETQTGAATYIGLWLSSNQGRPKARLRNMYVTWENHLGSGRMLTMICMFLLMILTSITIIKFEKAEKLKQSNGIGLFFGIWYFIIGVWYIQPKLNEYINRIK